MMPSGGRGVGLLGSLGSAAREHWPSANARPEEFEQSIRVTLKRIMGLGTALVVAGLLVDGAKRANRYSMDSAGASSEGENFLWVKLVGSGAVLWIVGLGLMCRSHALRGRPVSWERQD